MMSDLSPKTALAIERWNFDLALHTINERTLHLSSGRCTHRRRHTEHATKATQYLKIMRRDTYTTSSNRSSNEKGKINREGKTKGKKENEGKTENGENISER